MRFLQFFFALSGVNISTNGIFLNMLSFWGDRVSLEPQIVMKKFKIIALLFWIIWLESWKRAFLRLFAVFCTVRRKYLKNQYLSRHVNFLTDWKSFELQFLKMSQNHWFHFSQLFGLKAEKSRFFTTFAIFCNVLRKYLKNQNLSGYANFFEVRNSN